MSGLYSIILYCSSPIQQTSLLILSLSLFLSGCFFGDSNDGMYAEFKNIKTDQFIWSKGRGGIYWVSENEVILDAVIQNADAEPERGLYQVNVMDGSHIKIASIGFKGLYVYCFDGEYLHLKNKVGSFQIDNVPTGYKLVVSEKTPSIKGYLYSSLRCSRFKRETGYRKYMLSKEDGYLLSKLRPDRDKSRDIIHENNGVELVSPKSEKVPVELKSGYVFNPQYLIDRDMYFGYQQRGSCGYFWWLERGSWKGKTEKKCFGAWAQSSSLVFTPTKVGLFVEHHTMRGTKTYLSTDKHLYSLENVSARGSSLAPDGCRIAYGSGNFQGRKDEKDFRQVLKIINACEFMNNQPNEDKKIIIPDHIKRHS